MKFLVSSIVLSNKLTAMSKVFHPKAQPIFANFLFEVENESLRITVSDGECTQCSILSLAMTEGDGKICLPADRLLDALKNLSEQPIAFTIDEVTFATSIKYANGKYDLVGLSAKEYPIPPVLAEIEKQVSIDAPILNTAISQSLFAVSEDSMRPIMTGIYFTVSNDMFQSVATDALKLVRNSYKLDTPVKSFDFVLPLKAAKIIKSLTSKQTTLVTVTHNGREAIFTFNNESFRCRLLEGRYPNYNAIIPNEHSHTATIERESLLSAIKRVNIFTSVATGCIIMNFIGTCLGISGKDIDFSTSAEETLFCAYAGEPLRIGFKSEYIKQILENISSKEVIIKMCSPSKAAIILPAIEDKKIENLSLIMPMAIGN